MIIDKCLRGLCKELGIVLITYKDNLRSTGPSVLTKVNDIIDKSICVVADIGCGGNTYGEVFTNPNVALEIGIATSSGIPTILLGKDKGGGKVIANLQGQDILKYPDCVTYGNDEFNKLRTSILTSFQNSIIAQPVRIFPSQSSCYLDLLKKILGLPGEVLFTGPEFRSFFRPESVLRRWLKEVRVVRTEKEIAREVEKRGKRFELWKKRLEEFGGIDVYPKSILDWENDEWRGCKLSNEEKKGFFSIAISLIESFPDYEIALTDEDCIMKYWLKKTPKNTFVIFEGWSYVDVRESRFVGGTVFSDPEVSEAFEAEFYRLYENCGDGNDREWVKERFKESIKNL